MEVMDMGMQETVVEEMQDEAAQAVTAAEAVAETSAGLTALAALAVQEAQAVTETTASSAMVMVMGRFDLAEQSREVRLRLLDVHGSGVLSHRHLQA